MELQSLEIPILKNKEEKKQQLMTMKDEEAQKNTLNEVTTAAAAKESCRICLDEEDSGVQGKLFTPCQCTGTCKSIHVECLKQWVKKKVDRESHENPYELSQSECEICKFKYRMRFESQLAFDRTQLETEVGRRNCISCVSSLICFLVFLASLIIFLFVLR